METPALIDCGLVHKFVGLYNADGSLMGELRYACAKLTKATSCSLCDLTHGWNPFGKSSWKRACRDFEVEIDLLHRDEALEVQLSAVDGLPAIIRLDGDNWVQVLDSEQITSYSDSPRELLAVLQQF